ncbi:helix-turn-helix transcriptional regulator [Sporosarcina sp. FSL K6-5500]|uniref:helix-turn-helix transcriptional regulator n=1 Tax=Sporosarcina sp. FSL K6-5500 TaxID=2921558 RepID=UPI0030FC6C78
MSNYGGTIKKIRKSKGYTQKEVTGNLFTQATYSNFESDKSDILSTNFMHLLLQLQLTTDELSYIHNDYQFNKPTEIVKSFIRLPYNNKTEISKVISSIDEYHLFGNRNIVLEELRSICESLLIIETTGDFKKAREKVNKVWERISYYDQWYLLDIQMMNVILYFFDDDVVIYITDKLLERLKIYKNFEEAIRLRSTLTLNLSLLLIKNGMFSEALNRLEKLIESHLQELSYKPLAVCYNRMAICYSYTSRGKENTINRKIELLLEIYEDELFKQMIQLEYKKYSCD